LNLFKTSYVISHKDEYIMIYNCSIMLQNNKNVGRIEKKPFNYCVSY